MRVGVFLAALLLLATLVFTACAQEEEAPQSPTPTPSSSSVAEEFLGLWQDGSYSQMYDLLASSAQAEISRQDFVARYEAIAEEATISGVSYLFQPSPDPDRTVARPKSPATLAGCASGIATNVAVSAETT